MEEKFYMMWLFRSLGMSLKKTYFLLEQFQSPMEIWKADRKSLLEAGATEEICNFLEDGKIHITDWIRELDTLGIEYISINDREYPPLLREIADPPVGLYVKGSLPNPDDNTYLSVIGARRCSEYGRNMAYKFSKELAADGFTIVSGMAKGIDSMGHRGALEVGGKTVAVLGFGHCHCYPPENRELMKTIGEKGCLISEYYPTCPSNRYNFVQRNRIIAGLSKGLFVIEAGRKSGTLTTVDFASDDGRIIMTLPSNITSPSGEGTNDLIKHGCPMITKLDDIYFELGIDKVDNKKKKEEKMEFNLSDDEKKIYSILGSEAVSLDYITNKLKMPVQDIQYILTMLELGGKIQKMPGERYIRSL